MYVEYVLSISELPRDCIVECSSHGPANNAVDYWRQELEFTVDRDNATHCLSGYGAWSRDDLNDSTDEELAARVLWLACGSFREYIYECEDVGVDPFGDRPDDFDPSCGSDIFVLE